MKLNVSRVSRSGSLGLPTTKENSGMMPNSLVRRAMISCLLGSDALLHLSQCPVRSGFRAEEDHCAAGPLNVAIVAFEYRDMISTRASHHQRRFSGTSRSMSSSVWSSRRKKFMS